MLLDVHINGHAVNKIGEFVRRDGIVFVKLNELQDLGFRLERITTSANSGVASSIDSSYVALSSITGLIFHLDEATQSMLITVPDEKLASTILGVRAAQNQPEPVYAERSLGATVNYDFVSTFDNSQRSASGALDFRVFSRQGVLSSGFLERADVAAGAAMTNRSIRLDSTWTSMDIAARRRYAVGDFVTTSLSWMRPVRLEGFQIRSDFSMRPDLVTMPLPSISGAVAVPSTVELLSNGVQILSTQVDPGPFEIPQLPVMTGSGNISMSVTNALGQQTRISQSFYASPLLLATGLQTIAAQVGMVRKNWGIASNDFGGIATAASFRRGITSATTLEIAAEATPSMLMAGADGLFRVSDLGLVTVAVAASTGPSHPGAKFSLSAERTARTISFGVSSTLASRSFNDIAAISGDPVPRLQFNAYTSVSSRRWGSLGIVFAGVNQDGSTVSDTLSPILAQHTRVLSSSYSKQMGKMSLFVTAFDSLNQAGSRGLTVGLIIPFGKKSSASIFAGSGGEHAQLQAQQSAPNIRDWGYQVFASAGSASHQFANVDFRTPSALLSLGIDNTADKTTLRVESEGALSVIDHGLFASNRIDDSFAVVDVRGLRHVHVMQEDRDVGVSNSSGRLLVPNLQSFSVNHISIEPTDVAPDVTLGITQKEVRPPLRSGVVVHFDAKISYAALVRLIDTAGNAVPVGSTADHLGVLAPVGYDGDTYVQGLNAENTLLVRRPDGDLCRVSFSYKRIPGEIPTLGPFLCREESQ